VAVPPKCEMRTPSAVIEEYLKRHVAGKRKAKDVEREIRKELLPRWRNKPLAFITRKDVIQLVDEIKDRGAIYQAHNILGHVKTFFNWAIERGIYGIETSPCDRIKPSRLIGPKHPRQRVLTDIEIAAFWRASGRLGYPIGSLFRMLLLTGQRKSEVAEARWREFDLHNQLWVIPPERFKSDAAHNVPLSGWHCSKRYRDGKVATSCFRALVGRRRSTVSAKPSCASIAACCSVCGQWRRSAMMIHETF
jgi:integrase